MLTSITSSIQPDRSLTREEIHSAVEALLDPLGDPAPKGEFLLALRARGETPEEIACFAEALLGHAVDPGLPPEGSDRPRLDVCGTGGDKAGLFNVSTGAMFVLAACGVEVVKHGNRGLTSKSGGADVLEAMGVNVLAEPSEAGAHLEKMGWVFLFAPKYHPAFKAIAPVRQELAKAGHSTIFNILGPLLNPARPSRQLAGVFAPRLLAVYSTVFQLLGRTATWTVHGTLPGRESGLDEVSPFGPTLVSAWRGGKISEFSLDPTALAGEPGTLEQLQGGSPEENARTLLSLFRREETGPRRTILLLNASAALNVAGRASTLEEGVALAAEAIDSGRILRHLPACQA
jgi:anthranilate phosphoribosyltransferase